MSYQLFNFYNNFTKHSLNSSHSVVHVLSFHFLTLAYHLRHSLVLLGHLAKAFDASDGTNNTTASDILFAFGALKVLRLLLGVII